MRISLLQYVLAILIMTLMTFNAYAQEGADDPLGAADTKTKIYMGPVVGYNSVTHAADQLATFADDAYCPHFTGGTGQGFFFGWTYEHHFGKAEETTRSIIGRVMYSMYPGAMDVAGDEYPSLVPDPNSPTEVQIVRSATKHSVEIDYNVLAIEIMYKQNLSVDIPLGITVGPTFEIPMTKNILQEYSIVTPDNVQFANVAGYTYSDDMRTVTLKDGEIDNASGIRIGLKVGVQYEIILMQQWYMVPAVYYNFSLLNVKSDEDYRINAFQVGIDFRYAFGF